MIKNAKTMMVSARLPAALIDRVDFAVRNVDSRTVKNRSDAISEALSQWVAAQDRELERLGVKTPKK